jgi:hypothetical protein
MTTEERLLIKREISDYKKYKNTSKYQESKQELLSHLMKCEFPNWGSIVLKLS